MTRRVLLGFALLSLVGCTSVQKVQHETGGPLPRPCIANAKSVSPA